MGWSWVWDSAVLVSSVGLEVTTPVMLSRGEKSQQALQVYVSRAKGEKVISSKKPPLNLQSKIHPVPLAQQQTSILQGKCFSSQEPQRFHSEGRGAGNSQVLGVFAKGWGSLSQPEI